MLFDSSLRKELGRTFAATLMVILTIALTNMLIRTIGQAAGGSVAPQDVALLLGYFALAYLPMMLSLSLFVAVVLVVGRMYRDQEMAVWFASGVGLARFVRPMLAMAAPVLVVIGVLLAWVWPWVNAQSVELRERYQQRSDLSRVAPGVFQASADGRRVFFVERDEADPQRARNVFILMQLQEVESVTSARSGRLETVDGERWLVLDSGQRSETDLATGEHQTASFAQYRVRVDDQRARQASTRPPFATRTLDLLRNPTAANQGELAWRVGLFLAGGVLLLLALGLSAVNPRRANNWNLLFSLLGFVVYTNLVNLSKSWVTSERLSLGWSLLLLHGSALLLAMGLVWWRQNAASWRLLRPRLRPASP
ncbi:MAG: LPS export ABC transporter permease LptF [Rubrivivax sp.]